MGDDKEQQSSVQKRGADAAASETPAKRARVENGEKRVGASEQAATSPAGVKDSPSVRSGKGAKAFPAWKKHRPGFDRSGSGSRNEEKKSDSAQTDSGDKKERLPKKKVVVLVGYNGEGYFGSQINPGTPTIEGEFWDAFIKSGAISEDNANSHAKVGLCRAARTDSGVHAAVNVLCLKLILAPASLPEGKTIEEHINSYLPPQLRVWSIIRVQGGFEPRKLCDQRHYQYTLPTSVLIGPKASTERGQALKRHRESFTSGKESEPAIWAASDAFWESLPPGSTHAQETKARQAWRLPAEVLKAAREFAKAYEGSHNFYNFTISKEFRDRTCQRVMRSVEVGEPFLVNGVEYISVDFVGQSFMLHQIRKMIGLLVISVRSGTPASLVPEAYGPTRLHIPKVPGSGLMLLGPQYLSHDKHLDESNRKLEALVAKGSLTKEAAADQRRDPIRLPDEKRDEVEQFKREHIFSKMYAADAENSPFGRFIGFFDAFNGNDFDYLNPRGTIPSSVAAKKGEKQKDAKPSAQSEPTGEHFFDDEEDDDKTRKGAFEDE